MLSAFKVRSFRFQWPADLLTSWAFEMETLILGWYVLNETGSVQQLALIGSLQFLGTLISPMFGVAGDRLGRRRVLCSMRTIYAVLAITMMAFSLSGELTPYHVFAIVFLMGVGPALPWGRAEPGEALARLTVSEATIYGRYGYGICGNGSPDDICHSTVCFAICGLWRRPTGDDPGCR